MGGRDSFRTYESVADNIEPQAHHPRHDCHGRRLLLLRYEFGFDLVVDKIRHILLDGRVSMPGCRLARHAFDLHGGTVLAVLDDQSLQSELHAGDLVIDPVAHRTTRAGRTLRLKPREFELLSYLVQHPNQVHSRERLLLHVWGYEFAGDTRTVDVHVHWLRGKIEPDPTNPTRIQTVRGAGYLFTE